MGDKKIFISTAHRDGFDEQSGTGDVDYAHRVKELVVGYGFEVDLIQKMFDENEIYHYIQSNTDSGVTPVLHVMINAPKTGFAFSPAKLEEFKRHGGEIVITIVEFAKHKNRIDGQKNIRDTLEYINVADKVIFLDESDRNSALETATERDQAKIRTSQIIRVPATVKLSDTAVEKRGTNILSFGMIRQGKGFGYLLALATQIKKAKDNRRIIIVGTVQKHPTLHNNTVYDRTLFSLMGAIYPCKIEELNNKTPGELAKLLLKYEEQGEEKALPIELHLDVPEAKLPEICRQCKYAVQPAYRGGTLRNSSINSCLIHRFITYAVKGWLTPDELISGKYAGAMELYEAHRDDSSLFARQVYDNILLREVDPSLNQASLESMAKLCEDQLSGQIVGQKYAATYADVSSPSTFPATSADIRAQRSLEIIKSFGQRGITGSSIIRTIHAENTDAKHRNLFGASPSELSGRNLEQRKLALGEISPEEQKLFDDVCNVLRNGEFRHSTSAGDKVIAQKRIASADARRKQNQGVTQYSGMDALLEDRYVFLTFAHQGHSILLS